MPLQGQKSERAVQRRGVTHLTPRQCYLGTSSTYEDIFDFVDFGPNANPFLSKCGSKNEPTKSELAESACKEPVRLFTALETPEKYMNMLGRLAEDLDALKRDKVLFKRMKASKFLLGFVTVPANRTKNSRASGRNLEGNDSEDEFDEPLIKMYEQISPNDVVIVSELVRSNRVLY